jgi:hypothetical protein
MFREDDINEILEVEVLLRKRRKCHKYFEEIGLRKRLQPYFRNLWGEEQC